MIPVDTTGWTNTTPSPTATSIEWSVMTLERWEPPVFIVLKNWRWYDIFRTLHGPIYPALKLFLHRRFHQVQERVNKIQRRHAKHKLQRRQYKAKMQSVWT